MNPAKVYVSMAVRLAESLEAVGKTLRVFTDDPDRLISLAGHRAKLLTAERIAADPRYARAMDFWAAHHKLNMIRQFAIESWPNAMLDVDMILTQSATDIQQRLEIPTAMHGWVYDISSQVFQAYTRQLVQKDLFTVGDESSFPHWYGGEFVLGIPEFFHRLSTECERILPKYLGEYRSFHHIGDELVVSAAINSCERDFALGEAGSAGLVVRYWSSRTLHVQPGTAILRRCAFWHLPDMKWALSRDWIAEDQGRLLAALRARKMLTALRAYLTSRRQR